MSIILPHYPESNGLGEKYVQIVRSLFYKAKEEGKDLFKCLMIYCNIPLSGSLQSSVQILPSRSQRSDLSTSNTLRQQLGLETEKLRNVNNHEHLPSNDLHIGQDVMYQDATSKLWYQPLLPVYVCSQEVKTLLQGNVSPTGRHKLIWSPTIHKARSQKINIL